MQKFGDAKWKRCTHVAHAGAYRVVENEMRAHAQRATESASKIALKALMGNAEQYIPLKSILREKEIEPKSIRPSSAALKTCHRERR